MDGKLSGITNFGGFTELAKAGRLITFTNVSQVHIHIHGDNTRKASASESAGDKEYSSFSSKCSVHEEQQQVVI